MDGIVHARIDQVTQDKARVEREYPACDVERDANRIQKGPVTTLILQFNAVGLQLPGFPDQDSTFVK
jgi:hypothetical protein